MLKKNMKTFVWRKNLFSLRYLGNKFLDLWNLKLRPLECYLKYWSPPKYLYSILVSVLVMILLCGLSPWKISTRCIGTWQRRSVRKQKTVLVIHILFIYFCRFDLNPIQNFRAKLNIPVKIKDFFVYNSYVRVRI